MNQKSASGGQSTYWKAKASLFLALLIVAGTLSALLPASVALGDTAADVQKQIDDQKAQIAALEKEIASYESQLAIIGKQKDSLQGQINQLDISRKKISTTIAVTQKKINETTLQIKQLGGQISNKQASIDLGNKTIAKSLRSVVQIEDNTLIETLFTSGGLSDAWEQVDKQNQLEVALQGEIKQLLDTKTALTNDLNATQKKKDELAALKRDLTGQKQVLDQNRADQAKLLADTKDKESNYQTIIAQKQAAKAAFEKQLSDYESSLTYTLNTNALPPAGSGVLSFPLDPDYMNRCANQKSIYGNIYCLTQYFGNTSFAQSGAYHGKGHNGVDFGAPQGTRVVAALTGTVVATGNTDAQPGCYSYGKWVLVKHSNGLATLYGHLSVISVTAGDAVATGSLLGYSGKTGYATGPHLHFTVYVASQVRVVRYGDIVSKTNCSNVNMPVAPTEAYLNPISYL